MILMIATSNSLAALMSSKWAILISASFVSFASFSIFFLIASILRVIMVVLIVMVISIPILLIVTIGSIFLKTNRFTDFSEYCQG